MAVPYVHPRPILCTSSSEWRLWVEGVGWTQGTVTRGPVRSMVVPMVLAHPLNGCVLCPPTPNPLHLLLGMAVVGGRGWMDARHSHSGACQKYVCSHGFDTPTELL